MDEPSTAAPDSATQRGRGRGRGRSRGGVGKYLRARGRRGPMLRADFGKRAEQDEDEEVDSEEERLERAKYTRRQMTSNADRYVEPEPDPYAEQDPDAEPEPEIDLSELTRKQLALMEREDAWASTSHPGDDDDDVDESILAKTRSGVRGTTSGSGHANSRKGKAVSMEWDSQLDEMAREKAAAEALSDLKARLKKQAALPTGPIDSRKTKAKHTIVEAPPLEPAAKPNPDTRESMQGFLDDLLG